MSAEDFAPLREMRKERIDAKRAKRHARLESANLEGWTAFSVHHYYRWLEPDKPNTRLDWWPSANKWLYMGKYYRGGLPNWIKEKIK